jgi:hypothetical protein
MRLALAFGGLALGYVAGDLEGALALVERALLLNPNLQRNGESFSRWRAGQRRARSILKLLWV